MNTPYEKLTSSFLALLALCVLLAFFLVALFAPFLASNKPIALIYDGSFYFPLFRSLLYPGFYTKPIDLFFNLLLFTLPLYLLICRYKPLLTFGLFAFVQIGIFLSLLLGTHQDPSVDLELANRRYEALQEGYFSGDREQIERNRTFVFEQDYLSPAQKVELITRYLRDKKSDEKLRALLPSSVPVNNGWTMTERKELQKKWLEEESQKVSWVLWPLIRTFHWEEYVGGSQAMNQHLPWWELTRLNRKDFVSALIFGVRVSLVVGVVAVAIALAVGVPLGACAGFFAGRFDLVLCRFIEVWESMPTFFMLLFVVSILQNKSIFLVISIIGFFGWMGFTRFVRGEFFKQRNLSYVEAAHALGYSNSRIMFKHILPNAIPPLLTMLPFAMMGAISSEAGLSFLGLGEEGSSSWGVLMDEGRNAFPGESYLLWPPAILLTILLVAIALLGDALRDALDPKVSR